MYASIHSATQVGVEARPISVEAHDLGQAGKERFAVVGLPDTAVREAAERVHSAVIASGRRPPKRVVVNLAPADLRKEGSTFDLPIALAALGAAGSLNGRQVVAMGELALDGSVRGVRNALAAALVARRIGALCIVPEEAAEHAALVEGVDLRAVGSLAQAIEVAATGEGGTRAPSEPARDLTPVVAQDLASVRGQHDARRALEISAAGGHHLLLVGPPGSGKSLLASCLPGILPRLSAEEALEVALIWGAMGRGRATHRTPPFRAPHHSASAAALLGGGSGIPVPGEVSRAHRGVLYLDEMGEFPPSLVDGLRQPLEAGKIVIARKGISVEFPSAFQLVASTNPCPCGYNGDRIRSCRCGPAQLDRYRRRLSGPIADRFDLRLTVEAVEASEMLGEAGEGSAEVRARVEAARGIQAGRGVLNRELNREALDALAWEPAGTKLLEDGLRSGALTGRGFDRVRRVARTLADLAGEEVVSEGHVAEAVMFRGSET